jgi:hypothetical protein
MQKKIFLQRGQGGRSGRSPYVKYLLWAALCLMLLVIITPYLMDRGKPVPRRSVPSEKSVLKKELPKPPEPVPGQPVEGVPGSLAAKSEQTQESVKPPEPQPPQVQPTPAPTPAPVPVPATPEPQQPKPPVPTEPHQARPADLFPKFGPSTEAPAAVARPAPVPAPVASAAPKVAEPSVPPAFPPVAEAQKPAKAIAPAKPRKMYAVQVGYFREKQNAEDLSRTLKEQGYSVMICPSKGAKGNFYTVITKPVPTMSKAATLAEQIKSYNKISPIVVNEPEACKPGRKAVSKEKQKPVQ